MSFGRISSTRAAPTFWRNFLIYSLETGEHHKERLLSAQVLRSLASYSHGGRLWADLGSVKCSRSSEYFSREIQWIESLQNCDISTRAYIRLSRSKPRLTGCNELKQV